MSIHVAINHKTEYHYERPVLLSPHVFRLRPAPHSRTPIESYSLRIEPKDHFINWQQDPFGNYQARVIFNEPTNKLSIEVDVIADMTVLNPFDFFVEEYAQEYPFRYEKQLAGELVPYLERVESGPRLMAWLEGIDRSPQSINDFLVMINRKLYGDIAYSIRMEPGVQTCEETLERAIGSCRDTGWLLVQIMRHLGLAARFCSGYLVQLTADVAALDGPSGPDADFTDLHAWAEVYVPGAGWIGLDPTSGLFAGEGHIPLACTPNPVSAAPVTGGYFGEAVEVEFDFNNSVQRLREDPRVTKPYTEEQWTAINALGNQVDRDLVAHDVRLTMGGEPTFVSIDDMESAEWNTEADGPHKRQLANQLVRRLQNAFGQGGILHYGQGKWYPGEQLPRWKLATYWRTDGVPMWRDHDLLADISKDYKVTIEQAQAFGEKLCERLGLRTTYLQPAYEDALYYILEEGRVPANLDPLKANLKDPLERRRLAELLQRGLDTPKGYVLPLHWHYGLQTWDSAPWQFRRGHLFLMPGDSPLGLRLPLNELPWIAEEDQVYHFEQSQFADLQPLPDYHNVIQSRIDNALSITQPSRQSTSTIAHHASRITKDVPHTALCIEPRNGLLFFFMPPLHYLEHYLELIAAIELTAAELDLPIVMEGYDPPNDYRLQKMLVTPDPGVIEVNVHPVNSWQQFVKNTETLYEEARLSRLGTEKFMQDGRHTGTGGGNHVTLGAATPMDSPFLRRPDLLRSLVTYWQHHPGLSYLFSGMFIGPTSQAPRIDEGRDDHLYEVEIAFQQIPAPGKPVPPWLVDRVLRNLLVDITGNTHRAEFCIDKLFSPDSSSGRLGIVELRAFDMPPHARMAMSQMLLVRALISWFWQEQYDQKLVRWGTELHDRFLLPYYVEADLQEVAEDLQRFGYDFHFDWLAPFFEFRFPRFGTVKVRDMELEVRMAIEPWHVLGEEVTNMGTSRFVDSSVEKVQIKVSGLTEGRYIVTCNGRRLPLRSTNTPGEYVAGVRYQAWQPPSSLHPTLRVQAPLVFDIIDGWNKRAIGGCTYHVVHPGGRAYDDYPVNANVAQSRRVSRFWDYGYSPGGVFTYPTTPPPIRRTFAEGGSGVGPAALPPVEVNSELLHTLDLRWTPQIV